MQKPNVPSNAEHAFGRVASVSKARSSFNMPSGWKGAFDADHLIPIYLNEVLPGDSTTLNINAIIRTATPLFPTMDHLKVKWEAFFTPMRLLWENTEKFFGEQTNPLDSISFQIPATGITLVAGAFDDSIVDYMGLPQGNGTAPISVSVLPFRAYHLIYDEWYRDQNLQDSSDIVTNDTNSVTVKPNWWETKKRNKRPDYLTSGLPFPQKFEATTLPLGTSAPVKGIAFNAAQTFPLSFGSLKDAGGTGVSMANAFQADLTSHPATIYEGSDGTTGALPLIRADLSNALAPTVNEFRQSIAIQHINEQYARTGSRYPEVMKGFFGVTSEDSRLQRPELLAMGSSDLTMQQIPQTSETGTTAQGSLAAFGQIEIRDKLFTKSFTEHGFIQVILSVVGDITYSQGLEKMWSRRTKDDFYWPEYNGIGEQAILSKEIYADGTAGDDDVFAYQERFGEYKTHQSKITGLFRPKRLANLAAWHLSEEFATRPTLGDTFIQSNTPMDRIIAVATEPHFIADIFFNNKTARVMPKFSTPGLTRI